MNEGASNRPGRDNVYGLVREAFSVLCEYSVKIAHLPEGPERESAQLATGRAMYALQEELFKLDGVEASKAIESGDLVQRFYDLCIALKRLYGHRRDGLELTIDSEDRWQIARTEHHQGATFVHQQFDKALDQAREYVNALVVERIAQLDAEANRLKASREAMTRVFEVLPNADDISRPK
jgi:uncharacterized small protein (DUF1192 family)